MRSKSILTVGLICIMVAGIGCNESEKEQACVKKNLAMVDMKLVNTYNDMALQNAIITQHTLYPYQFVDNSASLNELGERDLAILSKHFVNNPGSLNIRKDGTPDELYRNRVDLVVKKLQGAGVDTAKLTVEDSMPGGSGVTSERLIKIQEKSEKQQVAAPTANYEMGAGTSLTK
jgi:hypothetical protein